MSASSPSSSPVDPRHRLSSARSVVVKLGTQVLSDAAHHLDLAYLESIARQVAGLRERGVRVTIVSSGATGAGLAELSLKERPKDLAALQAVAAVGQRRLMDGWARAFAPLGLNVGQVLLTREDFDNRSRFLNLRNTILALHELSAVPILNENDTISTDELIRISFGDNDILAALVTQSLGADLLVLLSVVDGVLDASRKRVPQFDSIEEAKTHLMPGKSALGRGGMNSKLEAARIVTGSGESMVVAHGRTPDVLSRICAGQDVGTLFCPRRARRTGRVRWIHAARAKGKLHLDQGASVALTQRNKSLLPAGITRVEGDFAAGDLVDILDPKQLVVARGLTNYSADELRLVLGKRSDAVRRELPGRSYDEAVHRDNLVILQTT